jgi:hypothetical protein
MFGIVTFIGVIPVAQLTGDRGLLSKVVRKNWCIWLSISHSELKVTTPTPSLLQ